MAGTLALIGQWLLESLSVYMPAASFIDIPVIYHTIDICLAYVVPKHLEVWSRI